MTCHLLCLHPPLSVANNSISPVSLLSFFLYCNQVSRLEAEKLELTGSLCSMQHKLTELETITQELEEERVTICHAVFLLLTCIF